MVSTLRRAIAEQICRTAKRVARGRTPPTGDSVLSLVKLNRSCAAPSLAVSVSELAATVGVEAEELRGPLEVDLKKEGRLEGLELGVPAACFGQRFCAWGAPCADARRGLFTARPRRLSIVGVRLRLRYAKALHARLGTWSPHQQPPGMLQRRLPAGPLSAFSTFSRRRIDVAFT
ncbi:uncharacterized protein LOC144151941 isoform X1 [Haemaphysalis longicornis]